MGSDPAPGRLLVRRLVTGFRATVAVVLLGLVLGIGRPVTVLAASDACVRDEASGGAPTRTAAPGSSPGGDRIAQPLGWPVDVVVDIDDPWGRVWVSEQAADRAAEIWGRARDLPIACRVTTGPGAQGMALDPPTGNVVVANATGTTLSVIDGRAETPSVVATIDLDSRPAYVAIDPLTRRAYISLPDRGQVAVFDTTDGVRYRRAATLDTGVFPLRMGVDPASGRLFVSNYGATYENPVDVGQGSVVIFDGRAAAPTRIGDAIPASLPLGVAVDPASGTVYIAENGTDELMTLSFPTRGGAPVVKRMPIDPQPDPAQHIDPVDPVVLPGTRQLAVTDYGRDVLEVFRLEGDGQPRWDRSIAGLGHAVGLALDPVTGTLFVARFEAGSLAAVRLDTPTRSLPTPPAASALPGPLEISLAPADVARSVGIMLIAMLLVGAPTPLFNETLEANLEEIQGWLGRLVPGSRGARGVEGEVRAHLSAAFRQVSASPAGLFAYLLAAGVVYSFLNPRFPSEDGVLILVAAIVGLLVATALAIVPGQRYVRRHYGTGGRVRVVLWTLGLAAACVVISRLAGLDPGYVYGIIGTFTFTVALTAADRGRMALRGTLALLGLGLAAWFLRIPFQPDPGIPATGLALFINTVLVSVFVMAVQGVVIGLIPLAFLPGETLIAYSRVRWLALWAVGLVLFAHVIVYPVTDFRPNPSPVALGTVILTVGAYGAIALGFWGFFWRRARQRSAGTGGAGIP